MWWKRLLNLLVVVLCATAMTSGPASAAPSDDPSAGIPTTTSGTLPKGFPDDLKKFLGTTAEFRSAPWFSGECKDRGGDMGAYINAAFAVEDRLIYWTATDAKKKTMLATAFRMTLSADAESAAARYVDEGLEPPKSALPGIFPAGDSAYAVREPVCADDLERWSASAWNAWGFQWASAPDKQSLADMRTVSGIGSVPVEKTCEATVSSTVYCAHAFWVNCEQADPSPDDLRRCVAWNRSVGQILAGTAEWVEANRSLADRIGDTVESAAAKYADAWKVAPLSAAALVLFIVDPQSVVDEWANSAKNSAVDLSSKALKGLAEVGSFDPQAEWFLRWYAMSTGIGVVVMGLMTLLALWRAAAKGETIKTIAGDLLGYAPAGVLLMVFAPMMAQLLVEVANLLSQSIVKASGPDMEAMITNVDSFTSELTAPMLPGGAIVGTILFLLLVAGALGVYFGLLMHANALPVLAVAAGIGFGMWVHPKWRPKALRPVLVFIGTVFAKPLLFLLLAVETAVINYEVAETHTISSAPASTMAQSDDASTLNILATIVVGFIVVGMAPWSLLRYAPLLPTRSDSAGFGANSGSLIAGALGGVANSRMWWGRGIPGGQRDQGPSERADSGGRSTRSGGAGGASSAGGGGDPGPRWRTTDGQGRSATEARFGNMLSRRASRGDDAGETGAARGPRTNRRLLSGSRAIAGTAASLAIPVAAQASAAALNKARAAAESAPGEAEQQQ